MTPLPVVPRARARRDVEDAIGYYLAQGATDAALGLVAALEDAYERIGAHPGIGSTRWGDEMDLPGLRSWPLASYPFAAFYVARADHVDVWRVLHLPRDLPLSLEAEADG